MDNSENVLIVVRIGRSLTTNAQCRLQGYETGWFIADEFNFGLQNGTAAIADTTQEDPMETEFGQLTIKKSIDPCTPLAFSACCYGKDFSSIEIHLLQTYYRVETGESANPLAVSPVFIFRFEWIDIVAWSVEGSLSEPLPKETCVFNYQRVATGWVNQRDGSIISKGWTREAGETAADNFLSAPWEYSFKARGRDA